MKLPGTPIAQKIKFSIKDFFSKCDQICSLLLIWSHLLKKSLMENFIFCAVPRKEGEDVIDLTGKVSEAAHITKYD